MILSTIGINGGVPNKVMDVYRNIDKSKIQFDFLVYSEAKNTFESEIKDLGGRIFYFGRIRKIGLVKFYKKFYNLINENHFSIVHSYNGINDGVLLYIAKKAGVDYRISHARGANINNKFKKLISPIMKKIIIKNSNKLLACSEQAGQFLFGKKDFEVIPNGLNTERFININEKKIEFLRKEIGITKKTLVLGHIGRFSVEKNHEFLLDIARILKDKEIIFKIVLVGDGELKQDFEKKISKYNLKEYFYLAGSQNNIEDYYQLFNVFLFPSYYEGFGNVAVEAQSAGKRVIASKGVSKEVDIGLDLVDFISLEKINIWIKKIMNYDKNNQQITTNKIRKALYDKEFDMKSIVERYNKLYNI